MLPPKEQMEQLKKEQQQRFQEPAAAPNPNAQFPSFGPPQFEEEEMSARDNQGSFYQDQDLEDYPDFEQEEQGYQAPQFEETEEDYEDESPGFGFTPPPMFEPQGEYPTPPSMRQKGAGFLRDEAIFEGGPTRSEIASWKKQFEQDGHSINLTEHMEEVFIWRTLNRTEYREIMALPNTDPLQREEIICEICTLFPYEYNFSDMAARRAGTPAVLAEQIMQESGFKKPSPPVRL